MFSEQGWGKVGIAEAVCEVFLVELSHPFQMFPQWFLHCFREESDAIFVSFSASDDDLITLEVDIFHA